MERAYTLKEIDRMRVLIGEIADEICSQVSYSISGVWIGIEDRLRTYLMAGIDPQELENEYLEVHKEYEERAAEFKKECEEKSRKIKEGYDLIIDKNVVEAKKQHCWPF